MRRSDPRPARPPESRARGGRSRPAAPPPIARRRCPAWADPAPRRSRARTQTPSPPAHRTSTNPASVQTSAPLLWLLVLVVVHDFVVGIDHVVLLGATARFRGRLAVGPSWLGPAGSRVDGSPGRRIRLLQLLQHATDVVRVAAAQRLLRAA